MRTTIDGTAAALGALVLLGATAPALAQPFANAASARVDYSGGEIAPRRECERLAELKAADVVQINARSVAAEGAVPAHCRVSGVLAPEIAFEVNLPALWNGRFYMIGNGGLAGEALDDPGRAAQRGTALTHGFAFAQTNTGHDSRKEPGGTFVLSNPQKAVDYAYRAVHLTASTAKAITNDYYPKPIAHSYWNSCSNGGRQGLIEAQRYPEDFDGIIANAPWVDQTGFIVGAVWNQRALTDAPLPTAKLALVAKHVMAQCDAVDGLADGIIDDPRNCKFDPARDVPACAAGADSAECLTPAQAGAVAKIYGGPVSQGKPYFPGFMLGSEAMNVGPNGAAASGWANLIVGAQPDAKPADFNLAEGALRYLVFTPPRPDYDFRTFNFDRDVGSLDAWGKLANANNPDLAAFNRRGGKLLMTYGWADSILQPLMGVSYYEKAVAANGPRTRDFFRLFMVPGMAHCAGGVGPDQHDAVTAIVEWVEQGTAPASLVARKIVGGATVRSRPLCPYPQVARHVGTGSTDEAANFRCEEP